MDNLNKQHYYLIKDNDCNRIHGSNDSYCPFRHNVNTLIDKNIFMHKAGMANTFVVYP
jgi:hypothetical protein